MLKRYNALYRYIVMLLVGWLVGKRYSTVTIVVQCIVNTMLCTEAFFYGERKDC